MDALSAHLSLSDVKSHLFSVENVAVTDGPTLTGSAAPGQSEASDIIGQPMGARPGAGGRGLGCAGMLPFWECFPLSITFFSAPSPPHKALFKPRRRHTEPPFIGAAVSNTHSHVGPVDVRTGKLGHFLVNEKYFFFFQN